MESRTWIKVLANDLGRLAQGIGKRILSRTNIIIFIKHSDLPANRKVLYVRLLESIRPNKTETHIVRVTTGGDIIDYPWITSTGTASLTTTKILLNSVISTLNKMFMTAKIKDFYYNNPFNCFEYLWMELVDIPEEVIIQYHLEKLASHGWIYIEIIKGVPSLKQADKVENKILVEHLAKYNYSPCKLAPAIWIHSTIPMVFTLCVDFFGWNMLANNTPIICWMPSV